MEKQELKINVPIPDGMVLKSVRSEIKDGVVVVIPEYKEKPEYKDGDILTLKGGAVIIYNPDNSLLCSEKCNNYYAGLRCDSCIMVKRPDAPHLFFGYRQDIQGLATEEERQKLFEALAKNGYKWNAEERKIEKALPRAAKGGKYFHISRTFQIIDFFEDGVSVDNQLYEANNYFLTREEAEKYAAKFKEMLKNREL
ncbi:hypothetical protein ACFX5L_09280 [Bacteroides sp. KG123]|uniref:hypothetical protein n=1 Tax=unclassified Bacteroides TaxID=2646097 RepID=UPI003D7FB05A